MNKIYKFLEMRSERHNNFLRKFSSKPVEMKNYIRLIDNTDIRKAFTMIDFAFQQWRLKIEKIDPE